MRKQIIVAGCPTDGSIISLGLVQPIHKRKAIGAPSSVRKQTDEGVATLMIEGNPPKGFVVRKHNSKSRRTIRLSFGRELVTEAGQRFVRILMWIKLMVYNSAGELVERRHNFRINYPLPSVLAPA